jgi:RNA polymerase sigma-70 factor (sigma-E family)
LRLIALQESTSGGVRPYLNDDKRSRANRRRTGGSRVERGQAAEDLEVFLAQRGKPLLRAAVLLTGSHQAGEDLLQAALERLLRHWAGIRGDPEAYLRRTLYHLAADGWRQQSLWRRKYQLLRPLQPAVTQDQTDEVDRRDALIRLLLQLPPRQRAIIVLRYWEQLSEAEAAEVLGCSAGTVKSATSRALARLRQLSDVRPEFQARQGQETSI